MGWLRANQQNRNANSGSRHSCRNAFEMKEGVERERCKRCDAGLRKLECEGNASDGPLFRLYVMPAGFRLSEDLAKADEASRPGRPAREYWLVGLELGDGRLCSPA
jgi:hypothetical protein